MKKILIPLLFLSCSREEIKQKQIYFYQENTYTNLGICACNEGMKLHIVGTIISVDSLQKRNK